MATKKTKAEQSHRPLQDILTDFAFIENELKDHPEFDEDWSIEDANGDVVWTNGEFNREWRPTTVVVTGRYKVK